jgi:hypothetical protein
METNYQWAKSFRGFLNESLGREKSANEIADLIASTTPDPDDIPHHFINHVIQSGKPFSLESVKITDILEMDQDVAEYVQTAEDRYLDWDEWSDEELGGIDQPIVIFENYVIDGYNRLLVNYENGEEFIDAWVSM